MKMKKDRLSQLKAPDIVPKTKSVIIPIARMEDGKTKTVGFLNTKKFGKQKLAKPKKLDVSEIFK